MFTVHLNGRQVATSDDMQRCIEIASIHQTMLEMRGPGGRVVGHISPAAPQPDAPIPTKPWITAEQLDREYAAGGGVTLEVMLAKVGIQ
jgi:hypothetical protein